MAKTIHCNKCGASDLTKISEQEYKCNYCSSRIVVEQAKFDFGSFFKTFNPNDLHKRTQTTYHADQTISKNASKLGCMVAFIALLGIAAGVVVPLIMKSQMESAAGSSGENGGWQLSYTQAAHFANGSKGPVVWVFQEENYDWKKNRSVLKLVDPRTGKELHKEVVVPEHNTSETVTSFWDLFNGGRIIGDTIFFTPKSKGLEGRNIYTAKKMVDQAYFKKQIGSPLAEAYAYNHTTENYLRVKSAEGTEYYYFPGTNRLINRETLNKSDKEKVEKTFFAFTGNGDKKAVLRIRQAVNPSDQQPSFYHSYESYKKEPKYYAKYYRISSLDSIPAGQGFFNGKIIYNTDNDFVVLYKSDLMEESPWIIGSFNVSGKNNWKLEPAKQPVFKTKAGTKPEFEIDAVNGQLIVSLRSGEKAACGIDIGTGKIAWTYRLEK